MIKILSIILLLQVFSNSVSSQKIVGCYWGSWTSINQIDVTLCTHAYYAFYIPDSNGGLKDSGLVSEFLALKSKNPSVKLFASIGGYNAGTSAFTAVASSSSLTSTFINSCLSLTALGFDGIDIDWEYPAPSEQTTFVNFLSTLKTALNAKGKLLAAAVSSGSWQMGQSYSISGVCQNLDLVNLMTYDMQWPYTTTGPNAGYSQVDNAVLAWINGGCSASKLVLGLPSYGYNFALTSSSSNGVGASASGASALPYRTICTKIKSGSWTTLRTDQTPYSYLGTEWISYDDVASITAKMNIVSSRNLPGAFFWSTEQDDYDNSCGTGTYPLIRAVIQALGGSTIPATTKAATTTIAPITTKIAATTTTKLVTQPATTTTKLVTQPATTTTQPATTTTQPTTTSAGQLVCSTDGFYAYPGNCKIFYRCVFGSVYIFSCASGTGWSQTMQTCVDKASIPGCS